MSSQRSPRSANDPDQGHDGEPSVDPSSHVERRSPAPDVVLDLQTPPSIFKPKE